MKTICSMLFARQTVVDVLPVALVVGTLLNAVNAYYQPLTLAQIIFHYLLPYCVASYGAVKTQYRKQRNEQNNVGDRQ